MAEAAGGRRVWAHSASGTKQRPGCWMFYTHLGDARHSRRRVHGERNHQGLGNELITLETRPLWGTHVRCRERLGGLSRYYHRAA